ncbi:MAG: hypothetical protein AABY22_25435 [Nanoarchaeota archaeon]
MEIIKRRKKNIADRKDCIIAAKLLMSRLLMQECNLEHKKFSES